MSMIEAPRNIKLKAAGLLTAVTLPLIFAGCIDKNSSPIPNVSPKSPAIESTVVPENGFGMRDYRDYKSQTLPFEMQIHPDWATPEVREGDGAIIIRTKDFKTIDDPEISIYMMDLSLLKRDISLQNLVDERIEMAKQQRFITDGKTGIVKAAEGKGIWLIDNHDARKVDTEFIDEKSGETLAKMVHFFIKDQTANTLWLFSLSANSRNFNDKFAQFQAMLATVELTNADVSKNPSTEMRDFKSKTLPLEMKLSPDWVTDDEDMVGVDNMSVLWITKGRWLNTTEGKGLITIIMHKNNKVSIDEYTNQLIDQPFLPFEVEEKEISKTEINGQPANRIAISDKIVTKHSPDGSVQETGEVIKKSVVYIFKDGAYLWEIRYDPSLPEFEKSGDDFDKMVQTFRATGNLSK